MDSYAAVSTALKSVIAAEFSAESITARDDKLHESLGLEGIEVGVSPIRQIPKPGNATAMETYVLVQFYMMWEKIVDPSTQVDPTVVTAMADRFRRKVESVQATAPGTNDMWYFEVTTTEYPDDPTGNKTRFEATVKATGDNTALINR